MRAVRDGELRAGESGEVSESTVSEGGNENGSVSHLGGKGPLPFSPR